MMLKDRAVKWLNENLEPWTFDGSEPIVDSLLALLAAQPEPPMTSEETQRLLGSDRPISIGKVPTDPIGVRMIASIVTAMQDKPMDDIPRRVRIDQMVPAELKIREAMLAVEEMVADVRLTNAVILLGQAKDCVADFVDGVQSTPTPSAQPAPTQEVKRDWHLTAHELIDEVRRSEVLTHEDLAARISAPTPSAWQPGRLRVDIRFGERHHVIEGDMGLYPMGVGHIVGTIHTVLQEHDRLVAALPAPAEPQEP